MEISSYNSSSPVSPSKPAASAARGKEASATRAASAPASGSTLSLNVFEPIQQAMNNCPDSRAEVIARGKALAADPNYPPAEVVGKLARLFVADAASGAAGA
jgi:hypothetical protein